MVTTCDTGYLIVIEDVVGRLQPLEAYDLFFEEFDPLDTPWHSLDQSVWVTRRGPFFDVTVHGKELEDDEVWELRRKLWELRP